MQSLERHGFRRHAAVHEHPGKRQRRHTEQISGLLPVHTRGRVSGHELRAIPDNKETRREAQPAVRGGRRRTEHLLVPRREHRQHTEIQGPAAKLQAV